MKPGKILSLIVLASSIMNAQSPGNEPDIQRRLEMIERGQVEAVKSELPTLMTNFQNHPGVLYLQGVLTTDGAEAAKIYLSIVDNFPKNEWADDALFKLYQYYYSVGLYKTADQKLAQLKQDYPFSAYAAEKQAVIEPKVVPQEQAAVVKTEGPVPKFTSKFTVQVGAFSTFQNAEELRSKFEAEGYLSNIFTHTAAGKKIHRVWVGEFQTKEEAVRFSDEIRKKFKLESIVVTR
ncbi:MAG: SPOR domain-containing protein [Ignavibacteriales bacterium]|nr:SPOR domain-containing protein [Ignavibacteriales bacterium]